MLFADFGGLPCGIPAELKVESGLDMTRKEDYLSPEEFEVVFKKTPAEFKALPLWKRLNLKKQVGLF